MLPSLLQRYPQTVGGLIYVQLGRHVTSAFPSTVITNAANFTPYVRALGRPTIDARMCLVCLYVERPALIDITLSQSLAQVCYAHTKRMCWTETFDDRH